MQLISGVLPVVGFKNCKSRFSSISPLPPPSEIKATKNEGVGWGGSTIVNHCQSRHP